MSLAPQLPVFQSRMFLASQYIHKYCFQISFLQRKVSQPGKLKNLVHLLILTPMLLTSTAYAAWRNEYVRFASEQFLTSWGEAFCLHILPHPTLLGPVQLPPSHLLQFSFLTEAKQPILEWYAMQISRISLRLSPPSCSQEKAGMLFFCWLFTLRGDVKQ